MDAITSHLRGKFSWLLETMLSDSPNIQHQVPPWMLAGCSALTAVDNRPVVIVAPFHPHAARWTALISALEAVRTGFAERVAQVCGPEPAIGSRVVVSPENRAYLYGGRGDDGSIELRCINNPTSSMRRRICPLRVRAQATGGLVGKLGGLQTTPPAHLIASLLGCDPMGNPDLLGDGVVLIDSAKGTNEFRSRAAITYGSKCGALQEFDSKSRLFCVHRTALDFIDSQPVGGRRVIVNGAKRLSSLVEPHKLTNHRLLIFAQPHELALLGSFRGAADFWFLEDDHWLAAEGDDTSIRLRHAALRDWTPRLVSNPVVEKSALELGSFCKLLQETDESPAQCLAGPAWGLLLDLAGRTRGFSENQRNAFTSQIKLFERAVNNAVQSLTPEMHAAVTEAISLMNAATLTEKGDTNSKSSAIYGLLHSTARTAMIVRSENEAKSLRSRFPSARAFAQNELPLEDTFEQIIVCGWLGSQRMSQILLSSAAPRIVLVGYGFEVTWLRSLVRRLQKREGLVAADGGTKLDIISAPEDMTDWPPPTPRLRMDLWPEPTSADAAVEDSNSTSETWRGIDIWNFEYQIKHRRKELELPPEGSVPVDPVPVRYVSFAGSGYAFFTTERSVPVVTDLLRAGDNSVKSCRVLELKEGDLVVFPQISGSDLIADVADRLLADRAVELRMKAGQYAVQLRSSHLSPEEFRAKAMKLGFKRSLATVREWFAGSRVIGPDSDEDIEMIQRIVGGTTWAAQCIEARHALKQAHGAAEVSIRKALLQQLEQNLDQIEASGCRVDLGELGNVWVQRVDSVSDHAESQPKSKSNRLLGVA